MEANFLTNYIHAHFGPDAKMGQYKENIKPWYNPYGDCIEFQIADEAVIAERIDNYLTILKSAITSEYIGFKIKDVLALIKKNQMNGIEISVGTDGKTIVSVEWLLFTALKSMDLSIDRFKGYSSALQSIESNDVEREVELAK